VSQTRQRRVLGENECHYLKGFQINAPVQDQLAELRALVGLYSIGENPSLHLEAGWTRWHDQEYRTEQTCTKLAIEHSWKAAYDNMAQNGDPRMLYQQADVKHVINREGCQFGTRSGVAIPSDCHRLRE
jgi:hypothetical protein